MIEQTLVLRKVSQHKILYFHIGLNVLWILFLIKHWKAHYDNINFDPLDNIEMCNKDYLETQAEMNFDLVVYVICITEVRFELFIDMSSTKI